MTRPLITSTTNLRVKRLRRLVRHGRREGVLVAHGYRQLRCALEAGARVTEVYAAPGLFLGADDARLVADAERRGATVVELSAGAFESVCSLPRPDGIAAVVARRPTRLAALPTDGLVLVAEAIERPGNLGTIVRTGCAAGVSGIVVCDGRTDVFHPETVHASVGTIFAAPLATASTPETLAWWPGRIVVATPDGARTCWDADYGDPVALVVGNERSGVTAAWRDAADETVRIPLPGSADSLNVAVAAGVVLFEALRCRTGAVAR